MGGDNAKKAIGDYTSQTVLGSPILCLYLPDNPEAKSRIFLSSLGFFKDLFIFNFMCIVSCLYVCLFSTCVQSPRRPEEGARALGTGVIDSFKLPCGCLDLNLGPLKEQLELLTTKPYLYPWVLLFLRQKLAVCLRLGWNLLRHLTWTGLQLLVLRPFLPQL